MDLSDTFDEMPEHRTRFRLRELAGAAALVIAFTAAPFAGYLNTNRQEITRVATVIRLGAVCTCLSLGALAVALIVARRARALPAAAATGAVAFLSFQWSWFAHGPLGLRYAQWLAVSATAAWAAARVARSPNGTLFFALLGAGLVAAPSVSYLSWRNDVAPTAPAHSGGVTAETATRTDTTRADRSEPLSPARQEPYEYRPSVYLVVLDGYGRSDILAKTIGYDDSTFVTEMEHRGFDVSDDSFSSYPATFLSITSILEMSHVATRPSDLDGGQGNYYPRLQGDNAAVRAFHERGYRYVHAESGTYEGTRCNGPQVDICIPAREDSHGLALDEVEFSLLRSTPARPLLDAGLLPLGDRYTDPTHIASALLEIRRESAGPYFVFAHVVAPHAPYRRRSDCAHRSRNVGAIGEGWKPDMHDDYAEALQCVQRQTLAAIDAVLRNDPEAIVLLTGDHGTGFTIDFEAALGTWSASQISERFPVFYASRLPPRCATSDPDTYNIVNSLRVVLACIDDLPPELLKPRAFLYRYGHHEVVEIQDLSPMLRAP